jgi:hypothetical protein
MSETNILRLVVFSSAALFLVFSAFEFRRLKDERERLVELKATRLQQLVSSGGLVAMTAVWAFRPSISAVYPIVVFAVCSTVSYALGKLYYRAVS